MVEIAGHIVALIIDLEPASNAGVGESVGNKLASRSIASTESASASIRGSPRSPPYSWKTK